MENQEIQSKLEPMCEEISIKNKIIKHTNATILQEN